MTMRISMLVLVAVSALLVPACSKKESKVEPEAFSCDLLQQRSETCAPQTLARVRTELAERKDHEQQFKMFEDRFNKKLAAKMTKAQCEKFQADKTRAARVEAMKSCYAKPDCDAFAACVLEF